MSRMKNGRKKVSQDELRRLMNKHKDKLGEGTKKIDSPLAKYTNDGTLTCVLCNAVVKSEAVWNVHINAKLHRDNIHLAKQRKHSAVTAPEPSITSSILKRQHESVLREQVPPKKIKGILKNAPATPTSVIAPTSSATDTGHLSRTDSSLASSLESHFNDEKANSGEDEREDDALISGAKSETLPEGFFDDPVMDAKARNVEYKDPAEEEWEKFQKEIKEELTVATQIIEEDQEEATAERQIEEIDEQLRNWNRVLELERRKEAAVKAKEHNRMEVDENDSSGEEEFDEFLDWRAKKSYR